MSPNLETGQVLVVIGTRPEAIKLAPVVLELQARAQGAGVLLCLTGQHRDLVTPVLQYFGLKGDIDLDLMQADQSLSQFAGRALTALDGVMRQHQPRCVIGQGDTTTAAVAAMTAFYSKIPFVHVEAGLRTHDLAQPFPEEFNRRIAALGTTLHCAPTEGARDNLLREGIANEAIVVTGNTIVDAMRLATEREASEARSRPEFNWLAGHRLMLVTCHRRENFGEPLERICLAIREIIASHPDLVCVVPVHPNPHVKTVVHSLLGQHERIRLVAPLDYDAFVFLMHRARLIVSDSGGIQEEAVSLGRPLLILREATERPEVLECEGVELAGTHVDRIISSARKFLAQPMMASRQTRSPFGDGFAARKIVDSIESRRISRRSPYWSRATSAEEP